MDLTALMKQNIENLNVCKEEFKKAQVQTQKTQIFQRYVASIENLNKIRNMKSLSQGVLEKLKEIIISASKEAETMKQEVLKSTTDKDQKNQPPNKNPETKNNQKNDNDSEDSKEKKEFQEALQGAIITEKPDVKWEDVAGLLVAKQILREAIVFPTKFPDVFVGLRKPWKGILMYGV